MSVIESLRELIGINIINCEKEFETISLHFSDGSIFAIYNKVCMTHGDQHSIVKTHLSKIIEKKEKVSIFFDNGIVWDIGFSANDFSGPESMQLVRPGKHIVIWQSVADDIPQDD